MPKERHEKPVQTEVKICRFCGRKFIRKRDSTGRLERYQDFLTRLFCSRACSLRMIARGHARVRAERGEPVTVLPLQDRGPDVA